MVLIVGKGVAFGRKEALLSVFGIFLAVFIQAPLVAFGAATLVGQSEVAYSLLRGAGAAYLVYLALNNIRSFFKAAKGKEIGADNLSNETSIKDGLITNLTNPKVLLFMLAFVPQFTSPDKGAVAVQILVLIFIMKTNGLVVNGLVGIAAGTIRNWLLTATGFAKWQNLFIACIFLFIAGWFVFDITKM